MAEFHVLYYITSIIVRTYKWLELNIFKLFASRLEQRVKGSYRKIGVEFLGEGATQQIRSDTTLRELNKKNKLEIVVHNKNFFTRVANHATLGMGESYMDKAWDCDDLVELSYRIFRYGVYLEYLNPWNRFLNYMEVCFFNLQSEARAYQVAREHYDIGNDLFQSFLDPWMTYSCGYWKNAKNLDEAQLNKMEHIAQKLKLKPGMRVLDIGCGWGGLCKYLAEKHGVECVGISISKEGIKYAKERCGTLPVDYRLTDYRNINEKFDRVVSVGMFEHVGKHNYRTFFETVNRCLKDDGILLLHTIGNNHKDMPSMEPFFHKYIFPNGCLPYYQDITKYSEGLDFVLEDWENFGIDYSKTLIAWRKNFDRNWPKISHKYGERFYRMWSYYLQFCAGAFISRKFQLWQVVFSKGVEGGYVSVR